MNLLLIGYGKMNRLVEELARGQGHGIAGIIRRPADWAAVQPASAVGIDFSIPAAVMDNLAAALKARIPLVIGTTGWLEHLPAVRAQAAAAATGVVYGANFSLGVQVFYQAVTAAARALPAEYQAYIIEHHHRHKLDAPSGTARELVRHLVAAGRPEPPVASVRAGVQPGEHTVGFDAEADSLSFTHRARSRRGFAAGALHAAQWIESRRGLHEFSEIFAVAAESF